MNYFKKYKISLLLSFFIVISTLLRFYNLNWGSPYYFHPDERNIASSVSQLTFPDQMNPKFFAYGSLPIYAIYSGGVLANLLLLPSNPHLRIMHVAFEQAIVISRFYSAIFSILLVPLLFYIGKKLQDEKAGIVAAFLSTTSVGLIQFAHFGTFEMWLTFFGVLLFWLCLHKADEKNVLLLGVTFGILVATKVSSLALLPLPIMSLAWHSLRLTHKKKLFRITYIIKYTLFLLLVSGFVYTISNPYVFLDTQAFESSIHYESGVALGTMNVFYTGEFFNAIPGLFQFLYVYPFLINPLITIFFIPAFLYIFYHGIKHKHASFLLLAAYYLIFFFSQAVLFVKWTRYMMPTLPFIYLIIALAIARLKRPQVRLNTLILTAIVCFVFASSYFITAFIQPDTRVVAAQFAQKNIPSTASILSEVYDLGILPFNPKFSRIELFNFYDLDPSNPELTNDLNTKIDNNDYIILPSQRVLKIRLNNPEKFPNGSSFYNRLTAGKLGYEKIYQTPCDLFCKITYMGDPSFRYEETANVFDRPTVYIFKKQY